MEAPKPRITGPMRSRINRLAHARAQQYALKEQARLMDEIQTLASQGVSHEALHAHLDAIEREAVL